jgi:hypothetical protein
MGRSIVFLSGVLVGLAMVYIAPVASIIIALICGLSLGVLIVIGAADRWL